MRDRLVPEKGSTDIEKGDRVRYGGNWDFEGEVTRVDIRSVYVSDGSEVKAFDAHDLEVIGGHK